MEGHQEGGRWWKWALAGAAITSTGAVCYLAYSHYCSQDKGDGDRAAGAMSEDEVARRLRHARALQMHALPSASPQNPRTPAPSKSNGPSKKLCAECRQPLTGLPSRCSSCKTTYYCNKDCQKKAWPEHRNSCKAARKAAATETAAASQPAAPPATAAQGSEETVAGAGAEAAPQDVPGSRPAVAMEGTMTMEETLASVLEESAANKTDQLDALFETSVMLFLRCDYRGAVEQLLRVQAKAREEGKVEVEGDVYKWLGHSWGKLSDTARAEAYFTQGAEFARAKGLGRLEVDCLGGLGILCRGLNDTHRAMLFLGRALELAGTLGDLDLQASMLCNMGNVLMQVNPEQGILALQQAVAMREMLVEQLAEQGERASLAAAIMEHATAMVNLASALYVSKKLPDAKVCYERALEIFEMTGDTDKVEKVLVNLANMCELQIKEDPESRKDAAGYRERLMTLLQLRGRDVPHDICAICLDPMHMASPSDPGKDLIMLACFHCYHDECWTKHLNKEGEEAGPVMCPTCRQPVLLYDS